MEELNKMMVHVFNDGYTQLIMPRFEELEEKIEKSKEEVKIELTETFKKGQESLSNRLEEVEVDIREINKKMDKVVEKNEDYGKRLSKVERIVKAN